MKYRLPNTLAHFNAAPQTHTHDLSDIPTLVFAEATKLYRDTCGQTTPQEDAVTFYTLNHCASLVRKTFTENEPLPEWAQTIMQSYTDACMAQGERMLHYILSITTREMRHVSGSTTFWSGLTKAVGPAMMNFIKINKGHNENDAVQKYMHHPPQVSIGTFIEGMSYGFWKGWGDYTPENWEANWSGGYGGPKWALVADAAKAMLTGQTSMETLVDTGYTLAHNGGPIFNKGMMYSSQNANMLLTALDVQRSGQMLDLMFETQTMGVKKTPAAEAAATLIKEYLPQAVKGYLDWNLVDALRPEKEKTESPTKYDAVTKKQAKPAVKEAKPKPTKPKTVAPVPPVAAPAPLVVGGKVVKVIGEWAVYPGQSVTTYQRTGQ